MQIEKLEITEKDLPQKLRAIADIVGLEAVFTLSYHFAGQRIYVPKRLGSCHRISATIGAEASEKLIRACGGCYLHFPIKVWKAVRDREILKNRSALSAVEIAQRYGLSPTYAWEKIRQLKQDNPDVTIELSMRHYRPSASVDTKVQEFVGAWAIGDNPTGIIDGLNAIIAEVEAKDLSNMVELPFHQKRTNSPSHRRIRQFLGTWFSRGFSSPQSLILALQDVISEVSAESQQNTG